MAKKCFKIQNYLAFFRIYLSFNDNIWSTFLKYEYIASIFQVAEWHELWLSSKATKEIGFHIIFSIFRNKNSITLLFKTFFKSF